MLRNVLIKREINLNNNLRGLLRGNIDFGEGKILCESDEVMNVPWKHFIRNLIDRIFVQNPLIYEKPLNAMGLLPWDASRLFLELSI